MKIQYPLRSAARVLGRLWQVHRGGNHPRAHPLAARRPKRGPTARRPQGAAAHGQRYRQQGRLPAGNGSRRLSRGSGGYGGTKGERGIRAPFGKKG
ncbi:hypothetical protein GW17_00032024 [Ensete ventricosum]|nr:hypothetical protein GW17_00032024 [Ensete ventricosum]RZR83693.1 hypothetical protein BHM03_00010375 [Ensete ventricosum]